MNKLLQKAGNQFLVSLTISDLLLVLIVSQFQDSTEEHSRPLDLNMNNLLNCFIAFTYVTSVLSTLGISLDRYISVEYSLRYHSIVTYSRVVKTIIAIWTFSVVFSGLFVGISFIVNDWVYYRVISFILHLLFSIFLMATAVHIRNVRNKHEEDIRRRSRFFGVDAEQLTILRRLKSSVADVLRLNIATAILYIALTITHIMWKTGYFVGNHIIAVIQYTLFFIYLVSNPIIYILFMGDLRKVYLKLFCSRCRKTPAPVNRSQITQNN